MSEKRKSRDPFAVASFIICAVSILIAGTVMTVKSLSSEPSAAPDEAIEASAVLSDVIEEDFWGDGQRHVRVKNTGDVPVYVKITPSFTAKNASGEICDTIIRDDEVMDINHDCWLKRGGSYYYSIALKPGKYTAFFVSSCRTVDAAGNALDIRFDIDTVSAETFSELFS